MRLPRIILFLFFFVPFISRSQPRAWVKKKDSTLYLPYQNGKTTFSYGGKIGIIDSSGRIIVPASFTYLSHEFDNDGDFPYRFYGPGRRKEGVLDRNLNVVIPAGTYDKVDIKVDGYFKVKKKGKYSFVDTSGKCMDKWFTNASYFTKGLAPVKQGRKWGYIDLQGAFTIPAIYTKARRFIEGLAAVKKDGYWGFIDVDGREIQPFIYYKVVHHFEGKGLAVNKNGKWGIINQSGEVLIPFEYDYAEPFHKGLALVKKDWLYGFINERNEIVIPFQFSKAYSFWGGGRYASVKLNSKWIDIDTNGNIVDLYSIYR